MNKKGFTLIELLVAITIMGILIGLAAPAVDNLMARNKTRKYNAYARSMERAAKLYMDSYGENVMSSNENYFCIKLTYQTLKNRKLLKDYQGEETCEDDDTYVYVKKNTKMENDKGYDYDVSIRCKKNGNEVYREEATAPNTKCDTTIDMGGIEVSVSPLKFTNTSTNDWESHNTAPNIRIKIKDTNKENGVGFASNTTIKYQWVKEGETADGKKWNTLNMGNPNQTSEWEKEITRTKDVYPTGSGVYELRIYAICDTAGHCSNTQSFGSYKFDNDPPKCNIELPKRSCNGYYNAEASFPLTATAKCDDKDEDQSKGSGCTNNYSYKATSNNYSVSGSTDSVKIYKREGKTELTYNVYDKLGNKGECIENINIDTLAPVAPTVNMYVWTDQQYNKYKQNNSGNLNRATLNSGYRSLYDTTWAQKPVILIPSGNTDGGHYKFEVYDWDEGTKSATESGSNDNNCNYRNVIAEGKSRVGYKTVDKACNESYAIVRRVRVDRSDPEVFQLGFDTKPGSTKYYRFLYCYDSISGIKDFTVDSSNNGTYEDFDGLPRANDVNEWGDDVWKISHTYKTAAKKETMYKCEDYSGRIVYPHFNQGKNTDRPAVYCSCNAKDRMRLCGSAYGKNSDGTNRCKTFAKDAVVIPWTPEKKCGENLDKECGCYSEHKGKYGTTGNELYLNCSNDSSKHK